MHPAGNRFEIVYRKPVWKVVPIPTYDIKWMRGIDHFMEVPLFLDFDDKVTLLIISIKLCGQLIITLAVG